MPVETFPIDDAVDAYQKLYDALGDAYWDSSDINYKDLIQGARDHLYEIITGLDEADLHANTASFISVGQKIKLANSALSEIKDQINKITKNLTTVTAVLNAIAKALPYAAML